MLLKHDQRPKLRLIIHGYCGGYWYFKIHPLVFNIEFYKDKKYACVNFKLIHQGKEAIFIKKNNEWIMKKSYLTNNINTELLLFIGNLSGVKFEIRRAYTTKTRKNLSQINSRRIEFLDPNKQLID